jgi:hypothetical protein
MRIVVLGEMGGSPYAGMTWLHLNWMRPLMQLGHDVWYVEDNGKWPYDPTLNTITADSSYAVAHLAQTLGHIGLGDRWVYRNPESGECHGQTARQLHDLYRSSDVLLNVCAATALRDEHMVVPARVWLETDPVVAQLKIAAGDDSLRNQLLECHNLHASYGENYGATDCAVPLHGVRYVKTRQPVDLERWPSCFNESAELFTTIANFRLEVHDVKYAGDVYRWSKHEQWAKIRTLPSATAQRFRLALKASDEDAVEMRRWGWETVDALPLTYEPFGAYQRFIQQSRGEITVAKDQNIRLRSGWFSERDACYLASGKPVVAQDTAFQIPTGEGLFRFTTMEEAAAAVDTINADYRRHCEAARSLAEEFFDGRTVVSRLLQDLGLE